MSTPQETPYDDDVEELAREYGWPLDEARDRFILAALRMGDVGPLVYSLVRGRVPASDVMQWVGLMLASEHSLSGEFKWLSEELEFQRKAEFRLNVKSRTGKHGPSRDYFGVAHRNWRIARAVEKLMAPGTYDAAIKDVASKFRLGEQTVRDAYDRWRRERHGNKSRK